MSTKHVGKTVDAKGYCEVSDCWCRYYLDPLTLTRATVRGVSVDVEARDMEAREREAAGGISTVLTSAREPCVICGKPLNGALADAGTTHAVCFRYRGRENP